VSRAEPGIARIADCDEVRELLPEHLLGTLAPEDDAAVRRHLRGCGGCRGELAMLGEGLATFSRAAHQADPPPQLRDRVLSAVAEEQAEQASRGESAKRPARSRRWIALAAAIVVAAGAIAWGTAETVRANRASATAATYTRFLDALGGREVRVAKLTGAHGRQVEGSAILYDSDVGQSWVLVLVRSPGATGTVKVVLKSPNRRIDMHPTEFNDEGSTDAWLVTSNDISRFDRVLVYNGAGKLLATGRVHQS
jgi:hypothetical protein